MGSFKTHCDALARLETFDPAVFEGDDQSPQEVCSFILALAVIFNDCKDAIYAQILLQESAPGSPAGHCREWGAYGGIDLHLFRYQVALIHELFKLIAKNEDVVKGECVTQLVSQLRANARDAWNRLVDVALGATPSDPLGRCLLLVRNKLSSHYDPKEIYRGYSQHFFGEDREDDRAFISRGSNMNTSRFYFADAAALGYLKEIPGGESWDDLRPHVRGVLGLLNSALMGVVEGFVQRRARAYRVFTEAA